MAVTRPERIQRRRTKGWRMPEGAVYVGRPSRWGNPVRVGDLRDPQDPSLGRMTAQDALDEFDYIVSISPNAERWAEPLRGHDLVCWCPLEDANGNRVPCHADVLLEIARG